MNIAMNEEGETVNDDESVQGNASSSKNDLSSTVFITDTS